MKRILFSGLVALVGTAVVAGCKPKEPPPLVPPVPATISSFTAAPAQAAPGETVLLTWETEDATVVSIRRRDGSAVPLDEPGRTRGSLDVTVDADEVFVLTARGEGGSDTAAAAVAVVEKETRDPLFVAVPDEVPAGAPVTLVWSAPGEGNVRVEDGAGAVVYEGDARATSRVVRPALSQGYTLIADGSSSQVQVKVRPVIAAFTATPAAIAAGEEVSLQWSVFGATQVRLFADARGELAAQTDPALMADGAFAELADFVSPTDGVVRYRLEAEADGRTVGAVLEVGVGVEPVFTELQVPAFGREGGSYLVGWKAARADRVEVLRDGQVIHVAQSSAQVAHGQLVLVAPAVSETLTFRASNARGGSVSVDRTVEAVGLPSFNDFSATPSPLPQGSDPVTLSWDVTNARRVRILRQGGPQLMELTGSQAETGTFDVYPNGQTTYILQADNLVGDNVPEQMVTVDVTTPARLVFDPATVPLNTVVQLIGTDPPLTGNLRSWRSVVKNGPEDAFVDIVETGTPLPVGPTDDTVSYLIALQAPFSTSVMGTPVSSSTVNVSINGWMSFSPATIDGPSTLGNALPLTALPHLAIAPYGEDLQAGPGTQVLWQLDGTGQQQRLIVQWERAYRYPSSSSGKTMTFQAQLFQNGRFVFAYKDFTGLTSTDIAAIGLQDANSTQALVPPAGMFAGSQPANGDHLRFGGELTLPVAVVATPTPYELEVAVVPGSWITISDAPVIIPPGQFGISEVNYNPAAGQDEWFEVVNNTASAINLAGWSIDFGGGNLHPISGSLILPANGFLVFGQTATAAESVPVDYVYGSTFSMPDAAGTLGISISGGTYASLAWTSPGTQGAALQVGIAQPELVAPAGAPGEMCVSLLPYGSNGQFGTPGAANGRCFPYLLQPAAPGGFQSIAATGTLLTSTGGTAFDSTSANDIYALVTLPRPVRLFGMARSQLWVSSNGFLTFVAITSSFPTNGTAVATTTPNGVLAPFWDDLQGQPASGGYWQQFDPDGTPGSGDEYTVVSWENWKIFTSTAGVNAVNFQVVIHEGSGDIEFHYGAMASSDTNGNLAKGSSATTWLENAAGSRARSYNVNSATGPGIAPFTGLRFAFTP